MAHGYLLADDGRARDALEDLPQDPGTSGLQPERESDASSPERPEPQTEETGTDAAGRTPRHRDD